MKQFNVRQNVGKARYVINYHDGIKTRNDGSPFFDICIKNRKSDCVNFTNFLTTNGYQEI